MITTYILITLVIIFLILSTYLLVRGISLVRRTEILESIILDYDTREDQTREALEFMLKTMRDIDIRGSFESDDEVGSVFEELKRIIEIYNNK